MTKEQLIEANKGLIYKIANRFYNVSKEDLLQVGVIGLLKAYDNYQKDGTTKFSTYAFDYIHGEMYNFIKINQNLKVSKYYLKLCKLVEQTRYCLAQKYQRIPTNEEVAHYLGKSKAEVDEAIMSAQETLSSDSDSELQRNIYEKVSYAQPISQDERIDVYDGLNSLNERERKIIKARYFKDMTQSEVAKKLNMTQVMVSRYEKKGIQKMRSYMSV